MFGQTSFSSFSLVLIAAANAVLLSMCPRSTSATCNVTLHYSTVSDLVNRLQARIRQVTTNDTEGRRYYPLVPGLVRLSFHACAGRRCGSYVDLNDQRNNGLQPVVGIIDRFWASLRAGAAGSEAASISKADLYALAGVAAFEMATGYNRSIVYRYGRHDSGNNEPDGDDDGGGGSDLPFRAFGTYETLDYFARVFNLSDAETVALCGAHSLGLVHDFGTGQPLGRWTDGLADRLTNEYYSQLLRTTWRQEGRRYNGVQYPLFEWHLPGSVNRLLLNSDVGLVRELVAQNLTTGAAARSDRSYNALRPSRTVSIVETFARNGSLFLDVFSKAFRKVIENGWPDLHDVVP